MLTYVASDINATNDTISEKSAVDELGLLSVLGPHEVVEDLKVTVSRKLHNS